jgi:hypothetical protein
VGTNWKFVRIGIIGKACLIPPRGGPRPPPPPGAGAGGGGGGAGGLCPAWDLEQGRGDLWLVS